MFKNLPVLQGKGFHSNTLNKWNDKKTISDTCVITLVQCVSDGTVFGVVYIYATWILTQ